jgi:CheY-like chemotaxis protein
MKRLRGRALVVDDQPVWLELFGELLHELGLEVATADNYHDAIELLNREYFHLAVVDVRLKDDDPNNTQGMDILSHINQIELDDVVVKVVITGYGTRDWARAAFKMYNVHDFIPKQGSEGRGFDERDFVESITSAFEEKIGINLNLDMEFVHGFSLDEMAAQIVHKDEEDVQIETVRWELDDLLRKMFPNAESLVVSRLSGGYSRTSVIKVEPFYKGRGQARAVIVKYGRVSEVETEADNFASFVKRFVAGRRHTNIDCRARTRSVGGIVYSLIGAPFEVVCSFSDFYAMSQATDTCLVLDDLFDNNCRMWYENRLQKRTLNLCDLYWRPAGTDLDNLFKSFQHMYPRLDQPVIAFREVDGQFKNPVYHSFVESKPIYLPVHTAVTHGDLNGDNILVDQENHTWLIDFFRTGEGHITRDFVTLESVIKFQLMEEESLQALCEFEKAILAPNSFHEELTPPQITMSAPMTKALTTIGHLRKLAGNVVQPSHDICDYYAGLFYHTLNLMRYYHLLQQKRRKYYILLSAAILCQRLEELLTTS